MALTMTRTRTQTALTKLAQLVANVHGELEMVKRILAERPRYQTALEGRQLQLIADRDALYLTLRRFDPELDPTLIAASNEWLKQFGRKDSNAALKRYIAALSSD